MNIPEEFINRVVETNLRGLHTPATNKLYELLTEYKDSYIDVTYDDKLISRIVIVFESTEDCLAFKLKYGKDYV